MASIIDAFNESLSDKLLFIKIFTYAIPVFISLKVFISGNTQLLGLFGFFTILILFTLLTKGVNNVRTNSDEILSFNFFELLIALIKTLFALIPQIIVFGFIGLKITNINIPIDVIHFNTIYRVIIWSIIFSVVCTSYLSFAKYLEIKEAYNYKVIFESCMEILTGVILLIPQLAIVNLIFIGPVAYIFKIFNIAFNNFVFVFYLSMVIIINISILANYFAQISYEHIKGKNEEYQDNYNIKSLNEFNEKELKEFKKRKR